MLRAQTDFLRLAEHVTNIFGERVINGLGICRHGQRKRRIPLIRNIFVVDLPFQITQLEILHIELSR